MNSMRFRAKYVSASENGDYYQVAFENTDPMSKLMNEVSHQAFGPSGTPGDPEAIVFVARRVGEVYHHALEWAQAVRRVAVDERLVAVVAELARFADQIIGQIEGVGLRLLTEINEALAQPAGAGVEARVVDVSLKVTIPNLERFQQALDKVVRELGLQ